MESVLPALRWIYEMKDDDFTQQASKHLKDEIPICRQVLSNDILCLTYVLRFRETKLILHVMNPTLVGMSVPYFIEAISTSLNQNQYLQVCSKQEFY